MSAPNTPADRWPVDRLVAALESTDASVRQRAFDRLGRTDDPRVVGAILPLLDSRLGFVVKQALQLLCATGDPAARPALQRFAETDRRFDLVWMARHGVSVIDGEAEPAVPGSAHRRREYGPDLVHEAITWSERGEVPSDGWEVVMMPSFHPEMVVTVGPREARVWLSRSSIWQSIETNGDIPASADHRVLTVDRDVLDEMGSLLARGFAMTSPSVHVDGLQLGGFRVAGGERSQLPALPTHGALLEFVRLVRSIGIATSASFGDYASFRDLGTYVSAGLETAVVSEPFRAMVLSGPLGIAEWSAFEAERVAETCDVVDLTGLRFVAPDVRPLLADWVRGCGAAIVANPSNPYALIDGLEHVTFSDWHDVGTAIRRPVLDVVGYWTDGKDDDLPHPAMFVDESMSAADRAGLADLLDAGQPYVHMMGYSPCRLCGRRNGSAELTDGRLVWPEGLGHYVRDHAVRLPRDVVATVRRPRSTPNSWLLELAASACERSLDLWRQVAGGER